MEYVEQNKRHLLTILVVLFCLALMQLAYLSLGHRFIQMIYEGRSIGYLNRIIEGQAMHSLGYYLKIADGVFYKIFPFVHHMNLCILIRLEIQNEVNI